MRKFFAIFAWLEIILGLAMLWMTFDVGLRVTGPFFGALIVLIGIVLLYGLLIYALVGWFIDRQHWPWYVVTLVVTLIYNVLAWSLPGRKSRRPGQRAGPLQPSRSAGRI